MRRKYNVGHQVGEQWVFGGYDVVDQVGCMVPVDRRDAAITDFIFKSKTKEAFPISAHTLDMTVTLSYIAKRML